MKLTLKSLTFLLFGMVLFLSYTVPEELPELDAASHTMYSPVDTVMFEYTEQVKEVIDQKCYDCHSEEGEDEEAKEELLWDELPKIDAMDQVYALDAIAESVEKGEMPPSKHVFWRPSKKLTEEEAQLLINWAKDLSDKLYDQID